MLYFPQYTMAIAIMAAPGAESAGLRDRDVQLNDSGICLDSKNTRISSESSLVQPRANTNGFSVKTSDPAQETREEREQRMKQEAKEKVAQNNERFQELLIGLPDDDSRLAFATFVHQLVSVADNNNESKARETFEYTAQGVAKLVLKKVASVVQNDTTQLREFMQHVLNTVDELIKAGHHAIWAKSMVRTLAAKLCVVDGHKRDDWFQAVSEAIETYNQKQESWSLDKFFDGAIGTLEYSVEQYVQKPLDPSKLRKTLSGI